MVLRTDGGSQARAERRLESLQPHCSARHFHASASCSLTITSSLVALRLGAALSAQLFARIATANVEASLP